MKGSTMKRLIFLLTAVLLAAFLFGQSVIVKDSSTDTLITINDEGLNQSSITIQNSASAPGIVTDKLYNVGHSLFWNGSMLGTGGSSVWSLNGNNAYYNAGKVGIGTSTPFSALSVGGSGLAGSAISGKTTDDYGAAVYGEATGTFAIGVLGKATNTSANSHYGGFFEADGMNGIGVYGKSLDGWAGYFIGKSHFEGYVGIGTTNPIAPLTIFNATTSHVTFQNSTTGTNTNDGFLVGHDGATGAYIWNYENSPLNIGTNDSHNIVISADGNVGIGTATPLEKLHVVGNTYITGAFKDKDGEAGTSGQILSSTATGTDWIDVSSVEDNLGNHTATQNIVLGSNWISGDGGDEGVFVTTSGNVGIGTSTPNSKLSVGGNGATDATISGETDTGSGVYGYASNFGHGVFGASSGDYGRGVFGASSGSFGHGVFGHAINSGDVTNYGGYFTAAGNDGFGVYGTANGTTGTGVYGSATNTGVVANYGGYFTASGASGYGVYGSATNSIGTTNYGGYFTASGVGGYGVYGNAPYYGGYFESSQTFGYGVYGHATGSSGISVYGKTNGDSGTGVFGYATGINGKAIVGHGDVAQTSYDFDAVGPGIDYGATSSIRWKQNIVEIDNPLKKLSQLRGVYFDWDAEHGGHHDIGCIAEEVGKVLLEIVVYEENGIDADGMDYTKLSPLLVEAVKALIEENEMLKQRLEVIELKLNDMQGN